MSKKTEKAPVRVAHKELVEKGILFEANRQYFHPLGLSMSIEDKPGKEPTIVVFKSDTPHGNEYTREVDKETKEDIDKATAEFDNLQSKVHNARSKKLGFVVQPRDFVVKPE
jgi:hypothetical protein